MSHESVKFTKHALRRARERKLWGFVNKKKFFYDAAYVEPNKSVLQNCVYVSVYDNNQIKIVSMYPTH